MQYTKKNAYFYHVIDLLKHIKSPACVSIQHPLLVEKGLELNVLRLDELELASGNKFFKLLYNIEEAKQQGFNTLISFGGAYSNHIYALAEVAEKYGFQSVGIIRGEESVPLNATLHFCKEKGMQIHYMNREAYRKKNDTEFIATWLTQNNIQPGYLIPEGGTNTLAVKGTMLIQNYIPLSSTHIICACGTGGTIAGIIKNKKHNQHVIGIPALKGGDFLYHDIQNLLESSFSNWELKTEFHEGGYAKTSSELFNFIKQFYAEQKILLDPIYTSKMLYGTWKMIAQNEFPVGSKITCIHTGGIQGWNGMPEKKSYISNSIV